MKFIDLAEQHTSNVSWWNDENKNVYGQRKNCIVRTG